MISAAHTPVAVRIPPPLMFLATFFAGLGLQHVMPLSVHAPPLVTASHLVGIGLVVCGVTIALTSVGMFALARTTLIPHSTASSLIVRGPYRFTRNPMYLSLVLAYLGAAGILFEPWPVVLLPIPVILVNAVVIPFEEARLRAAFGESFSAYCQRVRRWL